MTKCKKCGAPIIFIESAKSTPQNRKWIPVDEGLVPYRQGNGADYEDKVVTDRGELIQCTFDFQGFPTGMARIPHWATCPFADEFRRRK
jgi:hypothetical protein